MEVLQEKKSDPLLVRIQRKEVGVLERFSSLAHNRQDMGISLL